MAKVKELTQKLFCGETIVNKRDLWFIGGICLLGGIVYGFLMAPWTQGVTIASNNGSGNGWGGCCDGDCDCDCEEEE